MKKQYNVACPYCGQMRTFAHDKELTVLEQEDYVASKCTCDKANRSRKIEKTMENLPKIVGPECMQHGFSYELGDDTVDAIKRLVVDIVDDRIRKVGGGKQAHLVRNATLSRWQTAAIESESSASPSVR